MAEKKNTKIYMTVICLLGLSTLILMTVFYPVRNIFGTVFFCVLALIAETQTVFIGDDGSVSLSSAIIIAAVLTCGPGSSVWVAAVSVCGSITKTENKKYHIFNTNIIATFFNISNYVISISSIGLVYMGLHGRIISKFPMTFTQTLRVINSNGIQLLLAIIAGTVINALLVSMCLALLNGFENFKSFASRMVYPLTSVFFICLIGIFLTSLYVAYGWFLVILFFLPFMLARYVFITYKDLQQSYLQTVDSLASAIETKDPYTSGHSRRVEEYSSMIAKEMKISAKQRETLKYAALLHDVGKIGIPESILNKPGKLDDEEWVYIRSHPEKGAHIISDIKFLKGAVEIVRSHHEWYNGKGYPRGLAAPDLPLEAMILCAADSYDAMTSDRPYRSRMSAETAVAEMHNKAGTQFSPAVVEAFERALVKNGTLKPKNKTAKSDDHVF